MFIKKRAIKDEDFFEMLLGKKEWKLSGDRPLLPDEDIQKNFTGASGEAALNEAFDFYKKIKKAAGIQLNEKSKVLDFGCGWGRITRFWINLTKRENIYGVDPWSEMIDLCKSSIDGINFQVSNPEPPLNFKNESFDIIDAYSVFSHLNESYTNNWIDEFYRILKKGGILAITTRSEAFLTYCSNLREEVSTGYDKVLAPCFSETDITAYKEGRFIHKPVGGGDVLSCDFYGETAIPLQYFENLSSNFKIIYSEEALPYEENQMLIILKKF